MRGAGIRVPLFIDGTGWGQNIDILQANGPYLISQDPLQNLMFSVHMWWPDIYGNTPQRVIDEIAESVAMGLPLIVGEFAKDDPSCSGTIAWETIIQECVDNEVGYMPWSWGLALNSDCITMGMTCVGEYDTLGDQQPCDYGSGPQAIGDNSNAITIVNDAQYGIRANSVIPQYILNGFTCGGATDTPTNTPIPTNTDTPVPTNTNTPIPTNTFTNTQLPTDTNTNTPVNTPTYTFTYTYTMVLTPSHTAVPTNTNTPIPTDTNTSLPTNTFTNTPTDTDTPIPTDTDTPMPTNTFTDTLTFTFTDTPTVTNTFTDTPTGVWDTETFTETHTPTETYTITNTYTNTFTQTETNTEVPISTDTPVSTETDTVIGCNCAGGDKCSFVCQGCSYRRRDNGRYCIKC
jgi:hypothetical protein